MRLLFFLLFIGLNVFSQKINLGDISEIQNSSLDTLNQNFHIYMKNSVLTIDLDNLKKSIRPLYYEEGLSNRNAALRLTAIEVDKSIYFVSSAGGMVYTIKNDTVTRIDKSYDHGMQYGSAVFEHDNTAFKYGGYGFWSNRDFFTYYDHKQDEWEVHHPIDSDEIPDGLAFYYSIKNDNLFHVFGGKIVNPTNRRQQLNNTEVWTFDFDKSNWHFRGNHNEIEQAKILIPFDDRMILVYQNQMTLIDVQENNISTYLNSPITAQSNGIRDVKYANGYFYVIIANATGAYLYIVEEKDFFGELTHESKFYKNHVYWLKQGGISLLIMIGIIMIFWLIKKKFINRNKIKLLDNGLRYHLKFTEFDQDSMKIIKLMLSENEIPSSSILQIVEKEQYSPAHNERIKVQKINDINLKVATLLGIKEDIITNFKSPQDRRIRLYKISKKYFILKGLN